MNVMTIHSTLGPMIRMMTLMAFDVAQFLAMLFILMGFAGTFHVWFRHVPDDDAADKEDLRVNVINTLGAPQNISTEAANATDLDSAGYDTVFKSVLTLFSASLGDFSFDAIRKEQSFIGPFLMILYLFVGAVMLLNLLIAILSAVYEVQEGATKEFAFRRRRQ